MWALFVTLAWSQDLSQVVSGRWLPTQERTEVERMLADAVERSAASVSFVFRPLARPQLEPQATACPGYTMTLTGDRFRVQCDGKSAFEWGVGQKGSWTRDDGEALTVSLQRQGRSFVLDFAGERGGKKFTYAFPESGGLVVTQEVYSPQLGVPMVWTLSYARR